MSTEEEAGPDLALKGTFPFGPSPNLLCPSSPTLCRRAETTHKPPLLHRDSLPLAFPLLPPNPCSRFPPAGEQKLHYLPSDPAKSDKACTVDLKEGPVHDVQVNRDGSMRMHVIIHR